jgi:hypothetical protein
MKYHGLTEKQLELTLAAVQKLGSEDKMTLMLGLVKMVPQLTETEFFVRFANANASIISEPETEAFYKAGEENEQK